MKHETTTEDEDKKLLLLWHLAVPNISYSTSRLMHDWMCYH